MSNNNHESSTFTPTSFDQWCQTKDSEEVNFLPCWTIERFCQRKKENGQVMKFESNCVSHMNLLGLCPWTLIFWTKTPLCVTNEEKVQKYTQRLHTWSILTHNSIERLVSS